MNNSVEWIKSNCKTGLSLLGEDVASLLGEWAQGIYHLERLLDKVDWTSARYIELNYDNELATFDFDQLTALVFLAHWYCIRVSIKPCNFRYMKILFHRRKRTGDHMFDKHPTLEEAVDRFKQKMYDHQIYEKE